MPVGYVNEGRSHGFVLGSFELSSKDCSILNKVKGLWNPALFLEKGEYSLMCVLLFPEGVIGIKPRGDTREKQRTLFFAFWGGPFVLKSVRRELFSALKSSGSGSIFMKSQV